MACKIIKAEVLIIFFWGLELRILYLLGKHLPLEHPRAMELIAPNQQWIGHSDRKLIRKHWN
jgi:hypothetical protein